VADPDHRHRRGHPHRASVVSGGGRRGAGRPGAFSLPLPDSAAADITLSPDAGRLEIRGLPEASPDLLQASIREPRSGNVTMDSSRIENNMAWVTIDDRSASWVFWNVGNNADVRWTTGLSTALPLTLHLALGAGEVDADLSDMKLEAVDVKIGAGKVGLILPAAGNYAVEVDLAVGSVDIRMPEGLAVSVHCTTAIGNCALPNGSGFWSQNYASPGYEAARNKAQVRVNLAIGEAKIR
jgi:hypothetical protein